ncbi:MAG: right-handed parallel beta-helix repeat-containing protein, partial [Thermoplasmata archaeon]
MGRKVIAIWLSLIMIVGFVVIVDVGMDISLNVGGTTLYVNTTGSGGAYTSIQDAINNASDGDIVFVYNGTYYENIVVNITINLTGENRDTTIIDGGGNGDVVKITADWVNISGFAITNSSVFPLDAGLRVSSNFNSIFRNNIYSNEWYAIIVESNWNNIESNNISNNEHGLFFDYSNSNTISNNNISSKNLHSIRIQRSEGNTFSKNVLTENGIFFGGNLQHWTLNSIDTSNTINGKSIYYWKNRTSGAIPLNAGQVILANCTNVTVEDQVITNSSIGLQLGYSSSNQISNNIISSNIWHGISLFRSFGNKITGNNISASPNGIYSYLSNENNIINNNISNNGYG